MTDNPLAQELHRLLRHALGRSLQDAAQAQARVSALSLPRAAQATAPALLAQAHRDAAAQAEASALYGRCLAHYRQQVQAVLRPKDTQDDLGLAAAYFVLANLGAHEWREPEAVALPAIERQLRHLIADTQAWTRAPLSQRQSLFEQLALLGTLINESRIQARQQGPAAKANVQKSARAYLKQLLGLEPDWLVVTPQGLSLATTVH
jgi:hypothetical protein